MGLLGDGNAENTGQKITAIALMLLVIFVLLNFYDMLPIRLDT